MKEWRGIPREEVPWYPTIDAEKCTGCKTCIEICKNDVLSFDEGLAKAQVVHPDNCVVECKTCARLCPSEAISFPTEEDFGLFVKNRMEKKASKP